MMTTIGQADEKIKFRAAATIITQKNALSTAKGLKNQRAYDMIRACFVRQDTKRPNRKGE